MILDGKKVSSEIVENIKNNILKDNLSIGLAIIWLGDNPSSEIYIKNKREKCKYVGIKSELYHFNNEVLESDVIKLINELNERDDIDGIIIQSPVPENIDYVKCVNMISPSKDIDGFTNISIGNLVQKRPSIISCTPKGIIKLLEYYNIPLEGKRVCIINRSNIVGKPLFQLFLDKNATVTICHSKTKNLDEITRNSDIIVSAVGKPKFITSDMVNEDATIIDVGITRVGDKVVGDVDFDNVKDKVKYITPVPGGVGPMTIAMILENLFEIKRK